MTVYAQEKGDVDITFGIRAGVNFTDMVIENTKTDMVAVTSLIPGFQIGVLAGVGQKSLNPDVNKRNRTFIQTGLLIASQGFKMSSKGVTQTTKLTYLRIPVNFVMKNDFSRRITFMFQLGSYIDFAVGGKSIVEASGKKEETKIKFGTGDDAYMKGFDFGAEGVIGLQFGNIQAGLGVNTGFRNLSNNKDVKMHNFGLSLNAIYFF